MRIEILGSAAGGGFPQWNCACANCCSLRAGTFHGKSRTQTQVAVSHDEKSWFLLNASPDLRAQIEANPALHPNHGRRSSPIAGVILTSADLDQVAGLLSLRELQPLRLFCTRSLRRILQEDNTVFGMLNRIPNQVIWSDIEVGKTFALISPGGEDSGLLCEAFSVGDRYPAYVKGAMEGLAAEEASLGLIVTSPAGRRLAYLPAASKIDAKLLERAESSDLLLFDGTFWSDDELIRVQGGGDTATEMGHIPVSSPDGSIRRLEGIRRPRRIFIHVNNTNPMLDESSSEHEAVRAAGWEIAEDGWRLNL